jgi:FkbM family methyltransferase
MSGGWWAAPIRWAISAYEAIYGALSPREVAPVETVAGWIYVNPRDVGVAMNLMTAGIFEQRLTELLERIVEPGMHVIDGGANVGYFTMLASRLVGESGRVYAFEPEPNNFDLLKRGVERNGRKNVVAVRAALSNHVGTGTLFLDRSNLGAPSLRESNISDPGGSVDVETLTLDGYFEQRTDAQVDLIKLDTEGAEGLALAGAKGVITSDAPIIIMEFFPAKLRNMGTDPGVLLSSLRAQGHDIGMLEDRSGEVVARRDAELIAECERRDAGEGLITLILRQ